MTILGIFSSKVRLKQTSEMNIGVIPPHSIQMGGSDWVQSDGEARWRQPEVGSDGGWGWGWGQIGAGVREGRGEARQDWGADKSRGPDGGRGWH